MRPLQIKLSPADERALRETLLKPGVNAGARQGVKIILAMAQPGGTYASVSKGQMIGRESISRAIKAFRERGVMGVLDIRATRGRPRLSPEREREILNHAKAETAPTIKEIAALANCSTGKVSQVLQKKGLKRRNRRSVKTD